MGAEELLQKLLDAVGKNFNSTTVARIQLNVFGTPQQLPSIDVPDGIQVILKAWQGNAGIVWIGRSTAEANSVDTAWPLNANEQIAYRIQNVDQLYATCIAGPVGGGVLGDAIYVTVEQRRP